MIPHVPIGSTVRSLISARYGLGKTILASRTAGVLLHGFAAIDPAELATELKLTPLEVLRQHTLAALSFALQPKAEAEVMEQLMLNPPKKIPKRYLPLPLATNVRRCPRCVNDDVERIGFAFSRTLHQLATVLTCPAHHCPLEEFCAGCGTPYSVSEKSTTHAHLDEQLATCTTCGGSVGHPLLCRSSPGYIDYVKLLSEAVRGCRRSALLTPARRLAVIEHAAALARERDINLASEFARFWDATSFAEATSFAVVAPGELEAVFTGDKYPYSFNLSVVATSFALEILSNLRVKYEGDFSPVDEFGFFADRDQLLRRLAPAARRWELPEFVVLELVGGSNWLVQQNPGVRLDGFMRGLSSEDKSELLARQVQRRRTDRSDEASGVLNADVPATTPQDDQAIRSSRYSRTSSVVQARRFLKEHVHSVSADSRGFQDTRALLRRTEPALYYELLLKHRSWLKRCFPQKALFWEEAGESVNVEAWTAGARVLSRRKEVLGFLKDYAARNEGDQHLIGARKELRKTRGQFVKLCSKTDRVWFDMHVPRMVLPVDLERREAMALREEQRSKVLELLKTFAAESGGSKKTRSAKRYVRTAAQPLVWWFEKYDREWFEANVPGGGYDECWYPLEVGPDLESARAALLKGNYKSLSALNVGRYSLYSWLRKNHPDVLREHFFHKKLAAAEQEMKMSPGVSPARITEEKRRARREKVLQILEELRASGTVTGSLRLAVKRKSNFVYGWCLKHDKVWFDETVPHLSKRIF